MNQVFYAGYDCLHPNDFTYDVPEGFHCYLLILTTTPALFLVKDRVLEYPAHTAVLYPPEHKIWYASSGASYGNHWLRFASSEPFVTNFPQQAVPFTISDPDYCRNLFQLLSWEIKDGDPVPEAGGKNTCSLVISQLIRILFGKLQESLLLRPSGCHDYELLMLRRQIAAKPQLPWNVSDMAGELNMSDGYFQFLYKQKFHVSCMDDVIRFRLMKARDLLTCTANTVSQVAEECGYNSQEHFIRQFRKYTGITPGQYRKINE